MGISEYRARQIASEWHGGQWSPLYSFSSTGTVTRGALQETRACQAHADEDTIEELVSLENYLIARGADVMEV